MYSLEGLLVSAMVAGALMNCGAACSSPVRIMPLGDSITHGFRSGIGTNHYNSYRKTLKSLLDAGGCSTDFVGGLSDGDFEDNQHHGHDGWYADHSTKTNTIVGHAAGWVAATGADIVLLHIGTNDILGNNESASEVSLILDEIYAANRCVSVVLALIVNVQEGHVLSSDISAYNSNLNAMAQTRIAAGDDLTVVDMENGAGIDYSSPDMADTLHPSEQGYDKMATNWYPVVTDAVERQLIKKQPRIESVGILNNSMELDISNLCTGTLVVAEQADSLSSPAWTNIGSIVPASTETNWVLPVALTNDSAFFRLILGGEI